MAMASWTSPWCQRQAANTARKHSAVEGLIATPAASWSVAGRCIADDDIDDDDEEDATNDVGERDLRVRTLRTG